MKIAFVGKGGSGKTTLTSLFVRHLATQKLPVLAIDADINQHLAEALGGNKSLVIPPLGENLPLIKEYLRGDNPRVSSAASMIKTTPPGRGSRLLTVTEDNSIYDACVRKVNGVRLAVTGPFGEQDLGVACYHSKVGAVELLLNHMQDGQNEYVVVDMTAGADSFASGLFTRFDVTFLVCEPTVRSISVYRQYQGYSKEFGVKIGVIGNKIADDEDLSFLQSHIGDDLLGWISVSKHVKAAERGEIRPIELLESTNRHTLEIMQKEVDKTPKDWQRFQKQAIEFHLRNANAWANERVGKDLTQQVDPEFAF